MKIRNVDFIGNWLNFVRFLFLFSFISSNGFLKIILVIYINIFEDTKNRKPLL